MQGQASQPGQDLRTQVWLLEFAPDGQRRLILLRRLFLLPLAGQGMAQKSERVPFQVWLIQFTGNAQRSPAVIAKSDVVRLMPGDKAVADKGIALTQAAAGIPVHPESPVTMGAGLFIPSDVPGHKSQALKYVRFTGPVADQAAKLQSLLEVGLGSRKVPLFYGQYAQIVGDACLQALLANLSRQAARLLEIVAGLVVLATVPGDTTQAATGAGHSPAVAAPRRQLQGCVRLGAGRIILPQPVQRVRPAIAGVTGHCRIIATLG